MSTANLSQLIELNVGGQVYTTTFGTLQREGTSKLARLVQNNGESNSSNSATGSEQGPSGKEGNNEDLPVSHDRNGRIFIDRDGDLFRLVLDYLRNGVISPNISQFDKERFLVL